LLMVIIGGMGNFTAVLAGAAFFIALQETLSGIAQHWQLAMGLAIVLIVMFLPGGIAATPARIRTMLLGGEEK
jgi:branched-chain amino acid transport system permease protein